MGGPTSTVICGVALLALLSGCGQEKPEAKAHSRVFVQTVQPTDFAAAVTLTGDIQARVQTDLSFRVGGKIIQRMVDVGDRVTARQVLARLDPKDLQTNVDSAQAQVVAEQARVKQTAAAFVRQENSCPRATPAAANTTPPRPRCVAVKVPWPPRRLNWPMPANNWATPH